MMQCTHTRFTIAAIMFAILVAVTPVSTINSDDWTAFGGSDEHTGYKNSTVGNFTKFTLTWNATASNSLTLPIVYNGTVYVVSEKGVLYSYSEATGKLVKFCNLGGPSMGPATIGQNSTLYVQQTGDGTTVFGIDITQLKVKWTATRDSGDTYPYGVASSQATGLMYFPGGNLDNVMYGVNATTGKSKFESNLYRTGGGCDAWAPTVFNDSRVFFSAGAGDGSSSRIGEVNATTGDVLWTNQFSSAWLGYSTYWVPVVSKGIAIGVIYDSDIDIALIGVDLNNNHDAVWTTDNCQESESQDSTPATDGSQVYLTCSDGVHAFDLQTGVPGQVYHPCKECFGQAIITNDYVFAKSDQGIYAFEKASGKPVAEAKISKVSNIAYHNGTIFATAGAKLQAYRLTKSAQKL